MILTLRVFGFCVCSIELNHNDTEPGYELTDADPNEISGGANMNFERDTTPLDPSGEEPWDTFGFH